MTDRNDGILYNHVLLGGRKIGEARILRGYVVVYHILVSTPAAPWTPAAEKQYRKAADAAMASLLREGISRNVKLSMAQAYSNVTLQENVDPQNPHEWISKVWEAQGFPKARKLHDYLEMCYSCDEVPMILAFNTGMRSYAQVSYKYLRTPDGEASVIFRTGRSFMERTIRHELLHQFGASDLYYPAAVRTAARRIFPDSIMLCEGACTVDDLTAYTVGWTNTLSDRAYELLSLTRSLTWKDVMDSIHNEWKKNKPEGV